MASTVAILSLLPELPLKPYALQILKAHWYQAIVIRISPWQRVDISTWQLQVNHTESGLSGVKCSVLPERVYPGRRGYTS